MDQLFIAAICAQAEQLQPVFLNLVACLFRNGFCQCFEIVAFEELHLPAMLAKQKMLVPMPR